MLFVSAKGKHTSPIRFKDDSHYPREVTPHSFVCMEQSVRALTLQSSTTCSNGSCGRREGNAGWDGGGCQDRQAMGYSDRYLANILKMNEMTNDKIQALKQKWEF